MDYSAGTTLTTKRFIYFSMGDSHCGEIGRKTIPLVLLGL